ncbi:hypothetical protein GCM10010912_09990 [Paenibacillus albidus]|uniref:Sigma-70 family RNA polymerase sigma factor n=2 Tax=Paenibacillus albidus TaxID=2041023 RepID=A0A917C3Z5_9BACL|nr:hypothetical protein GCM10010912_09990 [Paenibacillus albidus]
MGKITVADIVKHYFPLVIQQCKNSYKGLEVEDRIEEGLLALIHAIRTYRVQYGCFEEYFLLQFKLIMKQRNKEAWATKRLESFFSLDAPMLGSNESSSHLEFISSVPHDDTIIDVNLFMERLTSTERKIVSLLINNQDLLAISCELGLSVEQVQPLIKQLQRKAIEYLDVDIK